MSGGERGRSLLLRREKKRGSKTDLTWAKEDDNVVICDKVREKPIRSHFVKKVRRG